MAFPITDVAAVCVLAWFVTVELRKIRDAGAAVAQDR
jgi:hypothetical protein